MRCICGCFNLVWNCLGCLVFVKFKWWGGIKCVFWWMVDLVMGGKDNSVRVSGEIVGIIVNDNGFFLIVWMIDDVNSRWVIETLGVFEGLKVLNISEREVGKNKYGGNRVKNKMINGE